MATITINKIADGKFEVTVNDRTTTIHQVTVSEQYAKKLMDNRASVEALVHDSFEFLLARESNTSILRNFDLSVIAQYFPEYEKIIA
jgi:hypothetical protein